MPTPAPALIIQYVPITPAFAIFATFLALCAGQLIAGLYIPRRYPRSNKRATLGPCPPSSASTAKNSPATDHAATAASRNAPRASMPDPRAIPPRADSGRHTVCEHEQ